MSFNDETNIKKYKRKLESNMVTGALLGPSFVVSLRLIGYYTMLFVLFSFVLNVNCALVDTRYLASHRLYSSPYRHVNNVNNVNNNNNNNNNDNSNKNDEANSRDDNLVNDELLTPTISSDFYNKLHEANDDDNDGVYFNENRQQQQQGLRNKVHLINLLLNQAERAEPRQKLVVKRKLSKSDLKTIISKIVEEDLISNLKNKYAVEQRSRAGKRSVSND